MCVVSLLLYCLFLTVSLCPPHSLSLTQSLSLVLPLSSHNGSDSLSLFSLSLFFSVTHRLSSLLVKSYSSHFSPTRDGSRSLFSPSRTCRLSLTIILAASDFLDALPVCLTHSLVLSGLTHSFSLSSLYTRCLSHSHRLSLTVSMHCLSRSPSLPAAPEWV